MMRKSANIILSFILSLMIVWIGSGIMTVVCEHTGNVSVAHQSSKRHCNDANANHCNDADANHCMRLQIKTLSPTDMAPTGFHHLQPVLLFVASAACNTLRLVAFARLRKGVLENVAPACAWHKTAISPAAYNTFNLISLFPIASNLSNGRPFVPFCSMQEGIIVPNYQLF